MLADVTQEVDGGQRCGPVQVVDHHSGVRPVEVQEGLDLALDALHPPGDDLFGVEDALRRRLRVTDESGGAADQGQRPVSGPLEATDREDLHEVADMQARRGGVEAAVQGHRVATLIDASALPAQRVEVGALRDEAAPGQLVEDVLCHGAPSSRQSGRGRRRVPRR